MRKVNKAEYDSYLNEKLGAVNKFIIYSHKIKIPLFRWLIKFILHVDLPFCDLKGLRMGHPFSIIVNKGTVLGRNVTIFHGCTIGSKRGGSRAGAPIIGNDVIIFPNSIIIGNINIGSGAVIGAGSIVNSDVMSNTIVAGNPAVAISVIERN